LSYPTHLLRRNEHYYYKIKIPVDLQKHFPTPYITKSLRTTDLQDAKTILVGMEYRTHRVFTMLRTGMLDSDMVTSLVSEIMPSRVIKSGKVQTPHLLGPCRPDDPSRCLPTFPVGES